MVDTRNPIQHRDTDGARTVGVPGGPMAWPRAWRDAVLPRGLPRVAVEAGVTRGWAELGCQAALGVDRFGESAPAAEVARALGFTAEALVALVQRTLAGADD